MSDHRVKEQTEQFYEFAGFRFYFGERRLIRSCDNRLFQLTPKANALLLALVRRNGEVVSYEELKKEVWEDTPYVLPHTIRETKHTLIKILGESAVELETITGKGYRFNGEAIIRRVESEADAKADQDSFNSIAGKEKIESLESLGIERDIHAPLRETAALQLSHPITDHLWHVVASCAIYSLLYTIALFIEVAYQFDRFGSTIWKIAPFVYLWIFSTSVFGLGIAWKRMQQQKSEWLVLSLSIFAGAALLVYIVLGGILPHFPVTEANFQTYTAHGAYLKSVSYFLFLAVVFLIIPFHFVISIKREMQRGRSNLMLNLITGERRGFAPRGTIYLKAWWLGLFLFVIAVISPVLTAHLFDNLKPHPQMNFFMQLVQWRVLLYLSLGLECLLWYYSTLTEIKRKCLESETSADTPVEISEEAGAATQSSYEEDC